MTQYQWESCTYEELGLHLAAEHITHANQKQVNYLQQVSLGSQWRAPGSWPGAAWWALACRPWPWGPSGYHWGIGVHVLKGLSPLQSAMWAGQEALCNQSRTQMWEDAAGFMALTIALYSVVYFMLIHDIISSIVSVWTNQTNKLLWKSNVTFSYKCLGVRDPWKSILQDIVNHGISCHCRTTNVFHQDTMDFWPLSPLIA